MVEYTVLLGAGASVPYNLPMFPEFFNKMKGLSDIEANDITIIHDILAPHLNLEEFYVLISSLRREDIAININLWTDIGQETYKRLKEDLCKDGTILDWNKVLNNLESSIPKCILSLGDSKKSDAYQKLIHWIISLRDTCKEEKTKYQKLEIITLNWDHLIEEALGVGNLFPRYPGLDLKCRSNGIRVIRPHGGLPLLYCPNGCPDDNVSVTPPEYLIWNRKPSPLPICPNCNHTKKYLIPAPFLARTTSSVKRFMAKAFSEAHMAIRNTKRLIIIGYSFPSSDLDFMVNIQNAISKGKSEEIIIVTSPNGGYELMKYMGDLSRIFFPINAISKIRVEPVGFQNFNFRSIE